ncbi:MAG: hypothetical protein QXG98_01910 [Candidatus Micrarchaeia archaeon]
MLIVWRIILLLQNRDIVRVDTRVQPGAPFRRVRIFLRAAVFFLKYLILFPLYAAVAFIILALTLLLISPSQNYELVIALSSSVIAATRLLAYYDERIAHEVIKLIPLTLLAAILLSPHTILTFSLSPAAIPLPPLLASAAFLIALEWTLRLLYTLLLLVTAR